MTANNIALVLITEQKNKESEKNIWKDSPYKDLITLQSNNVGVVGETFIQKICDSCEIEANVNGVKTKKIGGGIGDGVIKTSSTEIKTSHQGSSSTSFQHELGEKPWLSDYIIFVDFSPKCIYLTIYKNFTEDFYKSGLKCKPYFPTKSVTWRKKTGAFKLDTTIKINEDSIKKGDCIKITEDTDFNTIGEFINKVII